MNSKQRHVTEEEVDNCDVRLRWLLGRGVRTTGEWRFNLHMCIVKTHLCWITMKCRLLLCLTYRHHTIHNNLVWRRQSKKKSKQPSICSSLFTKIFSNLVLWILMIPNWIDIWFSMNRSPTSAVNDVDAPTTITYLQMHFLEAAIQPPIINLI